MLAYTANTILYLYVILVHITNRNVILNLFSSLASPCHTMPPSSLQSMTLLLLCASAPQSAWAPHPHLIIHISLRIIFWTTEISHVYSSCLHIILFTLHSVVMRRSSYMEMQRGCHHLKRLFVKASVFAFMHSITFKKGLQLHAKTHKGMKSVLHKLCPKTNYRSKHSKARSSTEQFRIMKHRHNFN